MDYWNDQQMLLESEMHCCIDESWQQNDKITELTKKYEKMYETAIDAIYNVHLKLFAHACTLQ